MTTSQLQWTDADLDRMLCAQAVISLREPEADRWGDSDDADVHERADLRARVARILGDDAATVPTPSGPVLRPVKG